MFPQLHHRCSKDLIMKIALIRYRFTPFGGAERYMSRLIEGLCEAGHEVHVFAAEWEAGTDEKVVIHQVPVRTTTGWLKALTFSLNCRKLIPREKPDIVFSLERTLQQDIYRAGDGCHRRWLTQKNLGRGILHKAWTWLNPFQIAYVWLERRLFTDPGLKAIIANSRQGMDDIVRYYDVNPAKIHVVYNGIEPVVPDEQNRERLRRKMADEFGLGDELRLLYVGSGFRRKGVAAAIAAAARLQVPFRLFIVGKGRAKSYRRLAERLGIGEQVIFTGPRRDVEMFYQGSDLFVFPTLYDPFSNATLEAMAHALPVITTGFNGVSELICTGENGFVVQDPLDVASIADCLKKLESESLRRRMGDLAAKTAAAYTMDRNLAETMAVISLVATNGRREK